MSAPEAVLFIDRDGTIIEEPPEEQIDSWQKLELVPGAIPALLRLRDAGYRFVMVSNQDGLGTSSFPEPTFQEPQQFLLKLLESQGIRFDEVFICPHFAKDNCECRKPKLGLLQDYLQRTTLDKSRSYVIGDRDTDLQLAKNLGIQGLKLRGTRTAGLSWNDVVRQLTTHNRTATVTRKTKETDITVNVDLDSESPLHVSTGLGFFDHMLEQIAKHGGFSLELTCKGDLHIDEHHTIEDCALALGDALRQALGDKRGIARYGFVLPMDEALAQVAIDLSGRPYFVFEGSFGRDSVGQLPTELVPHFFRSLGEKLGASINMQVKGENTHHMIEACFKAMGRTLRQAFAITGRELPSTKGTL